jgi:uncharacterized protein (TIGR01244 family)
MPDIRPLTETYAVAPQIDPADMAGLAAAGFTTIINNRPDGEIARPLQAEAMRRAAEAAGLAYVENPVMPGALTAENVRVQAAAIAGSPGPVLAYCASGNRSSIVWAMAMAGRVPADDLIAAAARQGYQLAHLRPHLLAGGG